MHRQGNQAGLARWQGQQYWLAYLCMSQGHTTHNVSQDGVARCICTAHTAIIQQVLQYTSHHSLRRAETAKTQHGRGYIAL